MTEIALQIYVKKDDTMILTPEWAKLLKLIDSTGSLLSASKILEISYNKAWKMLDAINTAINKPVVEKLRGGSGGGGATITSYGKFILNEYKQIEKMVDNFTKQLNTEINM